MKTSSFLWIAALGALALQGYAQTTKRMWEHQPPHWSESPDALTLTVPAGTDIWRLSGTVHDNAVFRYVEQTGDFEATVRVAGKYREQFQQAGLMVRIDDQTWLKCGIEFFQGKQNFSTVVTRQFSDWSVVPQAASPDSIWIRLQRQGDMVQVYNSLDGARWTMVRLFYFPPHVPVRVGMAAAAPGKKNFTVTFDHFSVQPMTTPPPHY